MIVPKILSRSVAFGIFIQTASATTMISLFADRLDSANGTPIAPGTLIQLVNLGANGVFDPINVADGTTLGLDRWTSGDDQVLNLAFSVPSRVGDFASTAAFDLTHSAFSENAVGKLSRSFVFGDAGEELSVGLKLGIRWFPGLMAEDFYAQGGVTLNTLQAYGQFTRQADPKFGGIAWIAPALGQVAFDSLLTMDAPNPQPDWESANVGDANLLVVPEPASAALSLIGFAGVALLRRRRG